jgi:hypothetical protein
MYVRAHDTEALDGQGRAVMVYTQEEVDNFRDEELIDYIAGIVDEKLTAARQTAATQSRPKRERASATRPRAASATRPRTSTRSKPRTSTRSTRSSTSRGATQDTEKQVTFRSARIIGDALGPMDEWAGDFLRLASEARRSEGRGTTVQRDEVLGLMGLRQSDAREIINQLQGVSSPSRKRDIVLDNFARLETEGRLRFDSSEPMPSSPDDEDKIDLLL